MPIPGDECLLRRLFDRLNRAFFAVEDVGREQIGSDAVHSAPEASRAVLARLDSVLDDLDSVLDDLTSVLY